MNAVSPQALVAFCDEILQADQFNDYCPNGLQIDANTPISKVITGVSACQALIDAAVQENAQAILVHHGYFWKGENPTLTGIKAKRIATLLKHGISLIAYHLPLDAHTQLGNNAVLAKALNLTMSEALYPHQKHPVGNIATCEPIYAKDFAHKITQALNRTPLHISNSPNKLLTKIGLCTGAAQDMIEQAYLMGCDAFISGEISERTTHMARELGVDYFAAGHHATERGGVDALGQLLGQHFGIDVQFVDIDNPV